MNSMFFIFTYISNLTLTEHKRTIQTILNLATGELIEADDLFHDTTAQGEADIFQLRTEIEKHIQLGRVQYVCIFCKQAVAIRGRKSHDLHSHFYFTHPYNSKDCVIKTPSRFTEEEVRRIKFNAQKESDLHIKLKGLIGQYAEQEKNIQKVVIDKIYRDEAISHKWRRPDVLAEFTNRKIAFELQLSTTFLSVIVARTLFYKQQNIFLLWVFPGFSVNADLQKFTQKDVYYNNNFNVFVFDKGAIEKSEANNRLFFKCYYQEHFLNGDAIDSQWQYRFVNLADITFNEQSMDCYFMDGNSKRKELQKAIAEKEKVQIADWAVRYVREQYAFDGSVPDELDDPFVGMQEDIVIEVNKKLDFTGKNIPFITKFFTERSKPGFLKFLCAEDRIEINFNLLEYKNNPILREVLNLDNRDDFHYYLACLFRKGYVITGRDQELIDSLYQKNSANGSEYEREAIRRWAFCKAISNLQSKEWAFDTIKLERVISSIASLQYGFPIGFAFQNLLQVSHNFLDARKEYGDFYMDALDAYGRFSKHSSNEKFNKKVIQFNYDKPVQNRKYIPLLYELFPEIRVYHQHL